MTGKEELKRSIDNFSDHSKAEDFTRKTISLFSSKIPTP
jgi:hypothetical protein